jgi:hypothetical protein
MEDEPQFTQEDLQALLATPPGSPRPDVTVTRIGDREIEQPESLISRQIQGDPSAIAMKEPGRPGGRTASPDSLSQEDLAAFGHVPDSAGANTADAAKQYARGTAAGLLETGPAISGAIFGGRMGSMMAYGMGPLAPYAPVIGAGAGFMAGLLTGKPLSELLVEAPESKDLVPYFEGGKTFGDTIAFAPAAFYLPSALGTRIGPYISRLGEFARKSPKSYLLGETTGGLSSSVGTILAEEAAPGQAGVRFASELTFGIANPARFVPNLTSWGASKIKTLWALRTAEGREAFVTAGAESARDEATRRLIQILEQQGEDIPGLIKALEEPLPGRPAVSYPPGGQRGQMTGPTSAQKTGSVALSQLEAALGTLDPNFSAELTEQGRQALLAFSRVVNKLQEAGSPEALQVAAEMREQFFTNAINNRMERANARAAEKISRITRDTPEARVQIGHIVHDEMKQALEDARAAERFYWERADREAMRPAGTIRVQDQAAMSPLVDAAYKREASLVLQSLRQARDINVNDVGQVSRYTKEKAVSIAEFIRRNGGITDIGGELAARDINNKRFRGLVKAPRETQSGVLLPKDPRSGEDAVREKLFDAGYFPGKRNYSDITLEEIADALEQDLSGNRFWQGTVREKLAPVFAEREVIDEWASQGIDRSMDVASIAARMRSLDEAARKSGTTTYVNVERIAGPGVKTIPRPRQLIPENTVRAYLERVAQIGPALTDSMIPADVRRIMSSLGIGDEAIALYRRGRATDQFAKTGKVHYRYLPRPEQLSKIKPGDLINYRSNLLALGRQARARGEVSDASFYSYLAESMLDDLSKLDNPAYDKAREFSNALNDVFTRTFANDLLGTTPTGADKYPAETLVEDAFGVGADLTALRMKEIENAVGFMRDRLAKAAAEAPAVLPGDTRFEDEARMLREFAQVSTRGVASIQDAQNRVLRLLASKTIRQDPATNTLRLNNTQLNKFVAENKPLLDQLGITGDLTDAVQAENVLRAVLEQNSALNTNVRKQTAFSQVLSFENPTNAIAAALRSKFPMRSMARIARLAQRGGPEAMEGLKSSLYDYVFTKASGGTDVLDPQKFKDAFFKPFAKDQPALADIMRTQGIMSPQELTNVRRIADQMLRIEDAMDNKVALQNVVQGADAVSELAMRVIGSKIGTTASGGGPGALIAASAGSKAIRQIFDKMPMMMVRKTIQRAAQDPTLMAQLLRRAPSEREKFQLAKSMHAYMLAAGLNYATYEEPPEAKVATQGPRASDQLQNIQDVYNRLRGRPQPPAPTTRGAPGLPRQGAAPPTTGAPAGGGAPTAGAPTQSRQMLQQLFPYDAIVGAAALSQNPMMPPMQPPVA